MKAEKQTPQLSLIQDVSIIDLLVLDHSALKESCQLLHKKNADRYDLISVGRSFLEALQLHSNAEKQTLYQELISHPELHFNILEAQAEHQIIDKKIRILMPKLKGLRTIKEETLTELKELADIVQIHLLEEEGELFVRINEEVDEATLNELGEKFLKMRRKDSFQETPTAQA